MTPGQAAEQAVVGALLLEPGRINDVREWLEPNDFDGTAERQAYEVICRLHDRRLALSPELVEQELRDSRGSAPPLADGARLVDLMQSCPSPGRAAVYGRMVLEMSIRRRVADQAGALRQRAERAVTTHELNLVFARVDSVRRDVERMHQRESKAARTASPTPVRAEGLEPLRRPILREDTQAERVAIHALVEQPGALGHVSEWLTRQDFGDWECSSLYGKLVNLHDAKKPIDRLTLAWEARRAGVSGPMSESLVKPIEPAVRLVYPIEAAREVLQRSVRASVLATTDRLRGLSQLTAANPTAEAYARLNDLWPQQRRVVRATVASR